MLELMRILKNGSMLYSEKVFTYGLMVFAFFIMVGILNHIVEYLFLGLLLFWLALRVSSRDFHFRRTVLDFPIFFFLLWILGTIPFAVDSGYSFIEWRKTLLQFIMFYFIIQVVRNESQVRQILLAFLIGLIGLSVIGIVDHLARADSLFGRQPQASSWTSAAQWFASYLVMGAPFVLLFLRESEGWQRKLYLGSLVVVLFALFLSHQRAAWLALFAQLIVLWLLEVRNKYVKWSIVPLLCVVILLGGLWFQGNQGCPDCSVDKPNHLSNTQSIFVRLSIWEVALEQIMDTPIVGYGYGNHTFQKNNKNNVSAPTRWMDVGVIDMSSAHLHNAFLSIIYGVGFVGLALFAMIFLFIIKFSIKGFLIFRGTFLGNLGLCVLLLVVGVVTRNLFDNMFSGTLSYLFWLFTGLYFSLLVDSLKDGMVRGGKLSEQFSVKYRDMFSASI